MQLISQDADILLFVGSKGPAIARQGLAAKVWSKQHGFDQVTFATAVLISAL